VSDLTMLGAQIECDGPIDAGTPVRILLTEADINFSGTVRHARPHEREDGTTAYVLGIQLELNDEMRVEMARLLARVIVQREDSIAEEREPVERRSVSRPMSNGAWHDAQPRAGSEPLNWSWQPKNPSDSFR